MLQTNGVYLTRPGLLENLIALGVKSYFFSLHSHKAAVYDKVTGSRGQYPRAVAGLSRLLRSPGCSVAVNVVVNAHNYRDLPGLVDFVARLGRPSLYFSMINERGHQKAPSWTVALEEAAPYLRQAVARCRKEGLSISRSGGESSFPVCLFDEPARHASQRPLPQERVRYAEDFSGRPASSVGPSLRPAAHAPTTPAASEFPRNTPAFTAWRRCAWRRNSSDGAVVPNSYPSRILLQGTTSRMTVLETARNPPLEA